MAQVTLGLTMICGSGEAFELDRCLKSARRDLEGEKVLFDEIVVGVNYVDQIDQKVLEVANKYATKVITFKWEDDFGGARNKVLSEITSEWAMWLDSDDVLKLDSYKKILELKPFLVTCEVVFMPYNYSHYDTGGASIVLPRERIVRVLPEIKWQDPIHEAMNIQQLDPAKPPFRARNEDIPIDHYKTKPNDPNRNLRILEREYAKPNCSDRIKFYYGKDLSEVGQWEKAVPILEDLVKSGQGFRDNLAVSCVKLSKYYIEKSNLDLAKTYAYKGIGFSGRYAEFFVVLGDIFKHEGDLDTAIKYYQEALKKKLDAAMSQMSEYYKYIPADRLSIIYYEKRDLEKALHYNTLTLECFPGEERLLKNRETMLNENKAKDVLLSGDRIKEIESFISLKGYDFELIHNFSNYADIKIHKQEGVAIPIITWMIPVLNLADPSVRIRRYNVHIKMKELGIQSSIITSYYHIPIENILEQLKEVNVVIFTQFGDYDYELMKKLKILGKRMATDHNEGIFNFPFEAECMNEVDVVVCVSNKLAEMTRDHGHKSTAVITDGIEDDPLKRTKLEY